MRIIYVDDERPALENFKWTVASFDNISNLELFQSGKEAIEWTREHPVDVAFLDMEMPGIHGLTLAIKLNEINENIRIVFVTAYSQYALEAFGVDAIGYVLKPYAAEDIRKELEKAARILPKRKNRVVIQTIPSFSVNVDGVPLQISRAKSRELFALLVDCGERGITTAEGISYLWPERANDSNAQSLFRMTYKRLVDILEEVGCGDIIVSQGNRRYLRANEVECDLYQIFSGDSLAARKYNGEYMQEYSWAEERNGQLFHMLILEK